MGKRDPDALDDAVLAIIAQEVLDHPDQYELPPETLRSILQRFVELLAAEQARRPAGRPRSDDARFVATLVECDIEPDRAIHLVALIRRKKVETVARAYRRHREAADEKPS